MLAEGDINGERTERLLEPRQWAAVEHDLRVHQRSGRNDQAIRLKVAQPGLVVSDRGVVPASHPVTGHK